MKTLLAILVLLCAGCATAQTPPKPIDLSSFGLSKFTHADLQNAAAMATKAGLPARAAMWTAKDQLLTAAENMVASCANALATLVPAAPASSGSVVGLATLDELATETLGRGIPTNVLASCKAIPVP
jgi:hypothetical protein